MQIYANYIFWQGQCQLAQITFDVDVLPAVSNSNKISNLQIYYINKSTVFR